MENFNNKLDLYFGRVIAAIIIVCALALLVANLFRLNTEGAFFGFVLTYFALNLWKSEDPENNTKKA